MHLSGVNRWEIKRALQSALYFCLNASSGGQRCQPSQSIIFVEITKLEMPGNLYFCLSASLSKLVIFYRGLPMLDFE
jgi:hypothetical protein